MCIVGVYLKMSDKGSICQVSVARLNIFKVKYNIEIRIRSENTSLLKHVLGMDLAKTGPPIIITESSVSDIPPG